MYTTHFMHPEQRWGVFFNGMYITSFKKQTHAQLYCDQMNGAV